MTDLSTKKALVVDNGLFVEIAIALSKSFGKVYYWTPWQSGFPKSNDLLIGDGLDEIERIKWLWDYIDKADIVVFPDVYFGDLQEQLRGMGIPVFGSGRGEELELARVKAKEIFRKIGLPVEAYSVITGLDDLRKYLKEHKDVWVKVSTVRGDFETFHSINYGIIEPRLDELEWKLGAKKYIEQFIVEANIEADVEIGYDGYCVDGKFPSVGFQGYEIKDLGLLGIIKPYSQLSKFVRQTNEALSPVLQGYGYRGFFSTELRIKKNGEAHLIDPCARAGSPPSELYQELFGNLGQIIWETAHGVLIDPEPTAKYGCEIMIHSGWADKNWQAIEFPKEIRQFVKLRNLTRINNRYYVVPQDVGLPEVGAVIGLGDTLADAINHAKENCGKVEGYFVECKIDSIDEALEQIKNGEKFGIDFGPVPDASEIK